ncbi:MAG TPA: ribosome maturation factor RimM [Casimicrobiaceae bacterium]|jgi:16S rRNA processing protein RimM
MGRVSAPYGVRGMVRVQPWSEDPLALTHHRQWWLRPRDADAWQARGVSQARLHGAALVAAIADVATRDDAEALRGADVGIARDDLPPLADDELYWADLEGLVVVNRDGARLGEVAGVIDNGAHAILRVRDAQGSERLIPWVPAYVDDVDVAAGRIGVDWQSDY